MKEVTYLGWQEKLDGSKFLLVNEVDGHSTVPYDKKKHILVWQENEIGQTETRIEKT